MGTPIVWSSLAGNRPSSPWLWGRAVDYLVVGSGASLLFALVAVPLTFLWAGFGPAIVVAFTHLGLGVNYPHYAATYQLVVRERRSAPRSFRLMVGSIPIALGVVLLTVAYPDKLLSPLLRIYLTWSPYHYAAQHFGIASMYSARHGRPLADDEKRLLKAGFVGVSLFIILAINAYTLDPQASGTGAIRLPPILPPWTYAIALAAVLAGVGATLESQRRLRRRTGAGFDPIVKLLIAVNFAWFVPPYVWIPGVGAPGPLVGPLLGAWIPIALPFFHCAQYLGMTGHRSRMTGPVRPVYLLVGLMVVGYVLFEVTARLIQATSSMGPSAAILLMAATVNVHHFWLDGIVWKRPRAKVAALAAPA